MRAACGEGGQEVRTFIAAATGLPTILLTAALVVVICFWLLAALGVADVHSFDTDVDVRAWRLSGVPATVALSLLTVLAWSLSVGVAVGLGVLVPPPPANGLLRLIAPAGALLIAWVMTCWIVGLLRREFPGEPVVSGPGDVRARESAESREAGETA
jgi:hypothetical protein